MNTPAYLKFYGRDLFVFTANFKKSEKAAILDGIIHLNMYGFWPENIKNLCEKNENFAKNFEKIEELFKKSLGNYNKICERNLKNASMKSLKNKDISNPVGSQSNKPVETHSLKQKKEEETEAEAEAEDNIFITADKKSADQSANQVSVPKDPNEGTFRAGGKTKSQKLACWWVKNYYPQLYQTAGKKSTASWFARYGRTLNEILNLADGSLPLAVSAILATQEQMRAFQKRKGEEVMWGLEAVSRNFTENFVRAQEIMRSGTLPEEVQNA